MGEWLIDLGNWLAAMLPANLQAPQATVRGAQLTSAAALAAAFLALVAAIIAGMVAMRNGYLTVRTTAQMKHADFRQAWINSLRDEMSTFQSLAVGAALDDKDNELKLAESGTKILLLMNPKDPEYRALLNGLHAVMAGWKVSRRDFLIKHAEMNALCQRILKREWNVTKREMHAIAHFFWVRWIIAIWRGFAWLMKQLYRFVIRPAFVWLEPRFLRPEWNRLRPWAKWGIRKVVYARRAYLAREAEIVVPDAIDINELDERKEGLARLVNTTDAAALPTSAPTPPPPAGRRWTGLPGRIRAAAAHIYRGHALP